jgi:hypothetical protein
MISNIYHQEVPTSCADDIECSTQWALDRMRAGLRTSGAHGACVASGMKMHPDAEVNPRQQSSNLLSTSPFFI